MPVPRIAYCTNVAPAETAVAVRHDLATLWRQVAVASGERPLGLGLWLADEAARELAGDAAGMRALRDDLDANGLELRTLNAFPARAFHAPVVKEAVYRPSWLEPQRFAFTALVARVACGVLPTGSDVPVSTLPLGFPKWGREERLRAAGLLFAAALELHRLRELTGTTVRLAVEPEPGCALETVRETVEFFCGEVQPFAGALGRASGLSASRCEDVLRRHLGVCLDLCHAAVEHEDPRESLEYLRGAGVPVFKVQVSAAVEVPDPEDPAQREAVAAFAEPRWLHQVGAPGLPVATDLPEALADEAFARRGPWRVHFHVPLDAARVGGLPTTRPQVERFLDHVATLDDPPLLELETYTWSAVPGGPQDLAEAVAREIRWVRARLGADPA